MYMIDTATLREIFLDLVADERSATVDARVAQEISQEIIDQPSLFAVAARVGISKQAVQRELHRHARGAAGVLQYQPETRAARRKLQQQQQVHNRTVARWLAIGIAFIAALLTASLIWQQRDVSIPPTNPTAPSVDTAQLQVSLDRVQKQIQSCYDAWVARQNTQAATPAANAGVVNTPATQNNLAWRMELQIHTDGTAKIHQLQRILDDLFMRCVEEAALQNTYPAAQNGTVVVEVPFSLSQRAVNP